MANLGGELSDVQTNILNVNVVLEAFGNAKTIYNNNSSRFVRFFFFCFFPLFVPLPLLPWVHFSEKKKKKKKLKYSSYDPGEVHWTSVWSKGSPSRSKGSPIPPRKISGDSPIWKRKKLPCLLLCSLWVTWRGETWVFFPKEKKEKGEGDRRLFTMDNVMALLELLGLGGREPESFNYLKHSGCTQVANIKDHHEYFALRVIFSPL